MDELEPNSSIQSVGFSSFLSEETLDALPFPAMVYRTDGLLVAYNTASEKFYGVPRAYVVGKFNMFETPEILDPSMVEATKEACAGRTLTIPPSKVEVAKSEELSKISDVSVWVECTYVPLRGPDGKVVYVFLLVRDVSELMEKRLAIEAAKGEIEEQRGLIARLEAAQREIAEQRELIQALESPIIEVAEGVLMLPIIGAVTERRAIDIMDKVLSAVSTSRARYLILDLTGSEHIDTTTANHFSSILRAVALLGAQGIVVGIRPHVAQTMTSLGLDLQGVLTYRNLREALNHCARSAGPHRALAGT